MPDENFQEGKMCCDKPLFHDDEDEEEEVDEGEEWFNDKYPNASCLRCDKKVDGSSVVYCGGGGGACETWYCDECYEDGTDDCPVCKEME